MKPTILAVDDNKAIRYLLQTILGKKYQVITAADASAAMYWLSKKNYPDVILADPMASDVGDWEFIANLKSSFLYKDIPTIVLSSVGSDSIKERCSLYNIEHFFVKPFNPLFLIETINQLTSIRKNDY